MFAPAKVQKGECNADTAPTEAANLANTRDTYESCITAPSRPGSTRSDGSNLSSPE
jgi:hypothetical protein